MRKRPGTGLKWAPALLAALALLAWPGAVAAAPSSAVDQYAEHVPGPGGDRPVKKLGPGRGSLPESTREDLAAAGEDGEALVRAFDRTAPARADRGGRPASEAAGEGEPGLSGIVEGMTGSGESGMGVAFVLILLVALLAAAAWAAARRFRQGTSNV